MTKKFTCDDFSFSNKTVLTCVLGIWNEFVHMLKKFMFILNLIQFFHSECIHTWQWWTVALYTIWEFIVTTRWRLIRRPHDRRPHLHFLVQVQSSFPQFLSCSGLWHETVRPRKELDLREILRDPWMCSNRSECSIHENPVQVPKNHKS